MSITRHALRCKDFKIVIEYNTETHDMLLMNEYINPELIGQFRFEAGAEQMEIASSSYLNIEPNGLYLVGTDQSKRHRTHCIKQIEPHTWRKYEKLFLSLMRKYKKTKSHLPAWW